MLLDIYAFLWYNGDVGKVLKNSAESRKTEGI